MWSSPFHTLSKQLICRYSLFGQQALWPLALVLYQLIFCPQNYYGGYDLVTNASDRFSWASETADWIYSGAKALEQKCHYFVKIFFSGCTGSCHFDNFQCSQWWKFRQNDISVCVCVASRIKIIWHSSVYILITEAWRRLECRVLGLALLWVRR